jgi:hypothetical protein
MKLASTTRDVENHYLFPRLLFLCFLVPLLLIPSVLECVQPSGALVR